MIARARLIRALRQPADKLRSQDQGELLSIRGLYDHFK